MPRTKNTRSRRTQFEQVAKISHPRTDIEISTALSNPSSPLSLELENNLMMQVDFNLALEKAINTMNERVVREEAKQTEAILRHLFLTEELAKLKQLQQVQTEQAVRLHKQAIQQIDNEHLRTLLMAKIDQLKKDKKEYSSISDKIEVLNQEKQVLVKKWNTVTEKKREVFQDIVKSVGLHDVDGKIIQDENQINAFAETVAGVGRPSFMDVMQVVCDSQARFEASQDNANNERVPGFIPPPPAPPPPYFPKLDNKTDIKAVSAKHLAMGMIQAIAKVCDTYFPDNPNIGPSMLKFLAHKENKDLLEELLKANDNSTDLDLFRDILINRFESSKATEMFNRLGDKIHLAENFIKIESEEFRFRTGKHFVPEEGHEMKLEKGNNKTIT